MPFSRSIRSSPFGLATFDVRRIITLVLLLLLLLLSHNLFVAFDAADVAAAFDSAANGMFFFSMPIDALRWPSYTYKSDKFPIEKPNRAAHYKQLESTYVCQSVLICT